MKVILALALLTFACRCSPAPQQLSDGGVDAAMEAAPVPTTLSIALDGDPNGLYWNAATSTLFIADDGNNRILTYTDAIGVVKFADLPAASASGPGLGQLIALADDSILVTRFGYGTAGDVVQVQTDGTSAIIPSLDATKRRIGLVQAPDGNIYDTYFVKNGTGYVGSVAKLDLSGAETDVVTGFQKPVGVLIVANNLYIDDQTANELYSTPYASPGALAEVAQLPDADLLCTGPSGTIFSGGADGNVRAIDSSGNVTVFASGFTAARGVAFDAAGGRLFIANHVGATSNANTIEVRPVP